MKKCNAPIFICLRCSKEIYGVELKHLVRLSSGSMHGTCFKEHRQQVSELIAEAIGNGTHSVTIQPRGTYEPNQATQAYR